jgi:hypothetical protein
LRFAGERNLGKQRAYRSGSEQRAKSSHQILLGKRGAACAVRIVVERATEEKDTSVSFLLF